MLELENDTVSSVYDIAGDDKERMVYDIAGDDKERMVYDHGRYLYVVGTIRA